MNTEGQQKYLNVTVLSRLEYWASQRTDRGLLFWKIPYNDVFFRSRNYQTSSNANNVLFSDYTINKKTFRRFFYILTFQMNKAVTILWSVPSLENASHTVYQIPTQCCVKKIKISKWLCQYNLPYEIKT